MAVKGPGRPPVLSFHQEGLAHELTNPCARPLCVWGVLGRGVGELPACVLPPCLSLWKRPMHTCTPLGSAARPGTGLVATSSCPGPQSRRFHGGKQPHCGGANQPTPVPSRLPSWPRWPVAPRGWLPGRLSSLVTSNTGGRARRPLALTQSVSISFSFPLSSNGGDFPVLACRLSVS